MSIARGFLIAGTHSGVGKTTISTGIMGAIKKRKINAKPFKVGPDYIDIQFHKYITDNPSRNLDAHLLDKDIIEDLFHKNLQSGDMAIVEGVMGLYDGMGTEKDQGSSAHISKILKLPVFLIIDGAGMSSSAAAMVLGYKNYDPEVNIAGIIINNISGKMHYELLKEAIERDTGIACIGYLNKNSNVKLESRHLGLIPCKEVPQLEEKTEEIVDMVEETIDIDKVIEISSKIKIKEIPRVKKITKDKKVRIAYAFDEAFNFYYEDNLDLIKEFGCELVPFSPLRDKKLPSDINGVYIGGGFPELYGRELEENHEIRNDILKKSREGMPIYAESGGFMYLTKEIETLDEKVYKMVGVFPARGKMTKRLQNFGYCQIDIGENSNFFKKSFKINAHEFHRSIVELEEDMDYIYNMSKIRSGKYTKNWKCGLEKNNTIGGFPHTHFYSNMEFVKTFIQNSMEK